MAASIDSGQYPTLEEILLRHGLKATDLDKQCPLEVRNEVAIKITDWKAVGRCFNFSVEKIQRIDRQNRSQDQCKVALLGAWSEREGERATYLKLAEVFHSRKRQDLVEFLCVKIKPSIVRLLPPSGASGCGDSVLSRIETLEEQFHGIHSRLIAELSTNEEVTVDRLLQALTLLPFAFRMQYQDTIQNMLPELEAEDHIGSLFNLLEPLFSFIDYDLLKHLVSKFGSATLKEEMSEYVEKVQFFKRTTTVSELIEYWPGVKIPESNFSSLRARIGADPGAYTLEELDKLRRRFFGQLRLSDFLSASILVQLERSNSFVAVWLIPTVLIPKLEEVTSQSGDTLFRAENILQLSVDKKSLYVHIESSTSYMTTLNESVVQSQPLAVSPRVC